MLQQFCVSLHVGLFLAIGRKILPRGRRSGKMRKRVHRTFSSNFVALVAGWSKATKTWRHLRCYVLRILPVHVIVNDWCDISFIPERHSAVLIGVRIYSKQYSSCYGINAQNPDSSPIPETWVAKNSIYLKKQEFVVHYFAYFYLIILTWSCPAQGNAICSSSSFMSHDTCYHVIRN